MVSVRDTLTDGIRQGLDTILSIPALIGEKLQELFVPDQELMDERLGALRGEFAFVDSIVGYGEHLLNTLGAAAGKAPSFAIDFGKSRGKYLRFSKSVTIDFSWYGEYKPMVDNILAGIIWITFLWHMYRRLPDLIRGNSMVSVAETIIKR